MKRSKSLRKTNIKTSKPSKRKELFQVGDYQSKTKKGPKKGRIKMLENKVDQLELELKAKLHKVPLNVRNHYLELLNNKPKPSESSEPNIPRKRIRNHYKKIDIPNFKNEFNFCYAGNSLCKVYVGETSVCYLLSNSVPGTPGTFSYSTVGVSKVIISMDDDIECRLTINVIEHTIRNYLSNFYRYFPIVDKQLLCLKLRHFTNIKQFYCDVIPKYLLYAIVAASFYNSDLYFMIDGINIGKLCCDCYEKLTDKCYEISENPTIPSLQILLHYVLAKNPRNRLKYWTYSGIIVRTAYYLNLNNDEHIKNLHNYSFLKNIWWACYVVDKFTTLLTGRPSVVKECDYDTKPLELSDGDLFCDSGEKNEFQNLNHDAAAHCLYSMYFTKISQLTVIMNEIFTKFYPNTNFAFSSCSEALRAFDQINRKLESWYADFDCIKNNPKRKTVLYDKKSDMFTYFYVCKIMIYKKLCIYQKEKDKIQSLRSMIKYSNEIKILIDQNEDLYINSAALYKTYPLYMCISVYLCVLLSSKYACYTTELEYKRRIFDVLKTVNKFGPQCYFTKRLLYNVIEKMEQLNVCLSNADHEIDCDDSLQLLEKIKIYENETMGRRKTYI